MQKNSKGNVIVVGSGLAGLGAANLLSKKGYSVTVLQAANYIGGRIKSQKVKSHNDVEFDFDLGASYIHHFTKKHPIYKLAKDCKNLRMVPIDDDASVVYDEEGKDVTENYYKKMHQYQKMIYQTRKKGETVKSQIETNKSALLEDPLFMHGVGNQIQVDTATSFDNLSSYEYHSYEDFEESNEDMIVLEGYQSIVENLAKHKHIQVLLEHEVVKVERIAQQNISRVICKNQKVFQAEFVICSVPLGVLKAKKIIFQPQLPASKQQAIQNIGFGSICKFFITFDKPIDTKHHIIEVITKDIKYRSLGTYFLNLFTLDKKPALIGFSLSEFDGVNVQKMDEEELKLILSQRLSIIAGQKMTPADFDLKRTNWSQNPYALGAYSFSGPTTTSKHFEQMARPVFENKWYFCGEHTFIWYRSTTHGAYLSGRDNAECIIYKTSDKQWNYWE